MEVLLIDNSNIINIVYATFVNMTKKEKGSDYTIKEEDLGFFWHLYVNKIKDYVANYENVIFCGEGFNSTKWRKEKYPLYKENRKARGENPDYDLIGKCYKDIETFLKLLPVCSLRTENCEADDEIYALAKYFVEQGSQVTIVSTDKDLTQICNFFDGVTCFNPITKTKIEPRENILIEKAMVGDTSDNIKGVPKIGQKTLEKMLVDKELWNKKMTPDNLRLYETIMEIVDLRKFPEEFHKAILDNFEKTGYSSFDEQGVEKFYFDNGLKQCLSNWSELSSEIKLTRSGQNKASMEEEIMDLLDNL